MAEHTDTKTEGRVASLASVRAIFNACLQSADFTDNEAHTGYVTKDGYRGDEFRIQKMEFVDGKPQKIQSMDEDLARKLLALLQGANIAHVWKDYGTTRIEIPSQPITATQLETLMLESGLGTQTQPKTKSKAEIKNTL
ncbi:MAG: hypothetical protein OXT65_04870 [Alphaproteobacteria bacterium]|nr:hypothetical protein [Alphaproteobacteria bacterium]